MAIITVQCRLQAEEKTLKYLWELGTIQNTVFVSEILEQIATHPQMQSWLNDGYIPSTALDKIADELKKQDRYKDMAARPTTSATTLVKEIYKSWFAVQAQKRRRLWGKKRWLSIIRSESELLEATNLSLCELQSEAERILKREQKKQEKQAQDDSKSEKAQDLFPYFMDIYDKVTKNYEQEKKPHLKKKKLIQQCAVIYLLKNQLEFANEPEDTEKYQLYKRRKEIEVEKLQKQLKARLPKGRSLEENEYLEALKQAEGLITENSEMELLQAKLLRSEKPISLPISYYTNTDVHWSKSKQGRICVAFNGMSAYSFEVFCNKRQLHWFERFYEDFKLHKQNRDLFPGGLITLRSASLIWKESKEKKGQSVKPWLKNKLYLHCSADTTLWTQEGTEKIRQQKIAKTQQRIDKWQGQKSLTKNQQLKLKANQTSLSRLRTFDGFSRSINNSVTQDSSIIMGVSIGLQEPITVAVVNVVNGEILCTSNTRQLLSKPIKQKSKRSKKAKKHTQYELFLRRRRQQNENDTKRQVAQAKFADNSFGESKLGKYVDRLIAKAVVEIAVRYRASSIVLPDLKNVREILDSEIQARAEAKIPGCIKAQKQYAKNYRKNIHRWSYARLCDAIKSKAAQKGISIELAHQTSIGSSAIQAKDLLLSAYHNRQQDTS